MLADLAHNKVEMDSKLLNTVMGAYMRCGLPQLAIDVFHANVGDAPPQLAIDVFHANVGDAPPAEADASDSHILLRLSLLAFPAHKHTFRHVINYYHCQSKCFNVTFLTRISPAQ